jgi:hypothetical protein
MADLGLTIGAFGVFVLAGLVVLYAVNSLHRPAGVGWTWVVAVSFVLGLGAVSLQMFVYAMVQVPLGRGTIAMPWLIVLLSAVGWSMTRPRTSDREYLRPAADGERRLSWFVAGCLTIVLLQVGYSLVYAVSKPISGWDAWAIWLFAAKAFFVSGGLPSDFFFSTAAPHPDYPLLTPLAVAWHYISLGRVDDQLGKMVFALSFLALLIIFWHALVQETSRDYASFFTALLSLTPILVMHAGGLGSSHDYVGYADLTLSVYFLGAATSLTAYQRDGRPVWFFLSALFLGMGAWTKNEGLAYAAVGGLLLLFSAGNRRLAGIGVGLAAAFVLPWTAFKMSMSLANDVVGHAQWLGVSAYWDRLPTIVGEAWRSMAGGTFGLLWAAFFISSGLNWRRLFAQPARSGAILVGAQLIIYFGVYLATPRDLKWHLGTSIDRVLLHVAPLALWLTGLNVYRLVEEGAGERSPGNASRPDVHADGPVVEGVIR